MIDEILKYQPCENLGILIRHADRELIPQGEIGNEIPINNLGIKRSIEFGEKLRNIEKIKIFSSPVSRCLQTAQCISSGYGSQAEIIPTNALGDPGLHVIDEKIAGEFYLKFGFDEMYKRFISDQPIPGVPSAKETQSRISAFIESKIDGKSITLFITHDSLIAFYHYALSGKIYSKENWVNYLEGIIIEGK